MQILAQLAIEGFATTSTPAWRGGVLRCSACRNFFEADQFPVASEHRVEGPRHRRPVLIVAATCPVCASGGVVVLGYGPEASSADSDVVGLVAHLTPPRRLLPLTGRSAERLRTTCVGSLSRRTPTSAGGGGGHPPSRSPRPPAPPGRRHPPSVGLVHLLDGGSLVHHRRVRALSRSAAKVASSNPVPTFPANRRPTSSCTASSRDPNPVRLPPGGGKPTTTSSCSTVHLSFNQSRLRRGS